MSAEKSPAFQFYPMDFLADSNVAGMALHERGAYITLLSFCWIDQSISADEKRLANMVGVSLRAFRRLWPALSLCFEEVGGRLSHPRLEKERSKQREYRQQQADKGKASAAARAAQKEAATQPADDTDATDGSTAVQPEVNRESSLQSSSLINTKNITKEALPPGPVTKPAPAGSENTAKAVGKRKTRSGLAFSGERLNLPPWTYNKLCQKIGPALIDEFDLPLWLAALDRAMIAGPPLPKDNQFEPWLMGKLDEEIDRRGISRIGAPEDRDRWLETLAWTCTDCGLVHQDYLSEAKKKPCLKRIQGDRYDAVDGGFIKTRH